MSAYVLLNLLIIKLQEIDKTPGLLSILSLLQQV